MEEVKDTTQDKQAEEPKVNPVINTEWADRQKWELNLRVTLRNEYEQLYETWKIRDLAEVEKKNEEVITEGLQKYYEKWQEEQKPPAPEDIQKLLDQEYETFSVKVQVEDGSGNFKTELFTLRELPQSAEIRFLKQIKERVVSRTADLQAFAQETMDQPFENKVKAFMSLIDEVPDVLADTVVIILNPFGKKQVLGKDIDRDWVQNNISSNRQWSIIEGQIQVNRVKDFFSRLSTSGQQTQMMMQGQRFQQLQRLVR